MTEKLTADEVAKALNYNLRHVYYLLRRGDLHGEKIGRMWFIPKGEVDEVRRLRGEFGRQWAGLRDDT